MYRQLREVQVPELETSVFVIPKAHVKNGLERYVVLNRIARSVIAGCRGEHRELVFTLEGKGVRKIYNSGWKAARRRAAERYEREMGRPCPAGSGRSGSTISSTRMAIGCVPPACSSRTARSSSGTRRRMSRRTTRRPISAT